jgi:hypothetical protein
MPALSWPLDLNCVAQRAPSRDPEGAVARVRPVQGQRLSPYIAINKLHRVFEFERAVLRHRMHALGCLNLPNGPFPRSVKTAVRVSVLDPRTLRFPQRFELPGVKSLRQFLVSLVQALIPDSGFRNDTIDNRDSIGLILARRVIRSEHFGGGGQGKQNE